MLGRPSKEKASSRRRGRVARALPPANHLHLATYLASTGSSITNLPMDPLSMNLIRPVILAKRVSSLPRPTLSPGFTRVPRCRTMMVPPGTSCPPNALNPSRCEFESRPFREVPCPFLCAISVLSSQLSVPSQNLETDVWMKLFLLGGFLRSLLGGGVLLGFRLRRGLVIFRLSRFHLLRLRFLLRQIRSLEALPAKSDLGDAHRRKRLPVSAQLLVLLFALEVENENLCAAALAYDFANNASVSLTADLSFFAGNRHHWKLNLTVGPGQFLDSNHIAGRHPVLLSTGADNRVHTSASVKCRVKSARQRHAKTTLQCSPPKAHTGAAGGQLISCACCVSAPALQQPR